MKECLKNIEHKYGSEITKSAMNPPKDDPQTFRLFQEASTVGVFNYDLDGIRRYLKRLQPSTFEELVALYAMYRPGPMDFIDGYIKRKRSLEPITYDHPIMEKYLKETYGVIIYQEQLMLLSQEIANFTPEESDLLARAVCCQRLTQQETALKEKFIRGGIENGDAEELLEEIWRDWMRCGNYLFNKSHAVCYTWLAYKMAYLKAHYPEEFMQAYFTINDKAI